jgi:oligopeptide/dipeptide ABC transporter ATP-binding protein
MPRELLTVENLVKYYPAKGSLFYSENGILEKGSTLHAVDGVSFTLAHDSTLGIVGESGCGKTTLARTILLLTKPTSGKIFFEDTDLTNLSYGELAKIRPNMQMVFQDPFSSLDPRMRAKSIVSEPLRVISKDAKATSERVTEIFRQAGLREEHLDRFPNEFSAGQRQRIAVARALVTKPKLVVLDEPTSALDASVQAQILNLLSDLQERYQLSYLFISHNMNVVRHMSDRIAVMYLGKIVEIGDAKEVTARPKHPYTSALNASVPEPNPRLKTKSVEVKGEPPSPVNPPPGCRYNPRCPFADQLCRDVDPELRELGLGHYVACHHPLA